MVQPSALVTVVLWLALLLPLAGALWVPETLALAVTVPVVFGSTQYHTNRGGQILTLGINVVLIFVSAARRHRSVAQHAR